MKLPVLRLAVLGSTKGTDLDAVIQAIKSNQLNASIEFVLSDKSDAFILTRAKNHGLKTIFLDFKNKTREQFCQELMDLLDSSKIDLIVLIGFMRILTSDYVEKFGLKTMNIHPSLLPAFAGGMDKNVHQAVLDSGIKETGCTLHFVSEQADQGPIILQKKVSVSAGETVDSLKEKVQQAEQVIIVQGIRLFSERKIKLVNTKVVIEEYLC
ncbi:MAG: phosphoribosylglycinamide formyltransferase [Candidatus Diapherotrites archaeon]|nr:phosphoribosylglycinamide formyltransferase [Candidatus Diapherotrites archaeon]